MNTYTYHGQRPRVMLEDWSLPHQITQFIVGHDIAVSCTCLGSRVGVHSVLDARKIFPAEDALTVWRAHVAATAGINPSQGP